MSESSVEIAGIEIVNFSNALYLRLKGIFAVAYMNREGAADIQEAVLTAVIHFMGRSAPDPFRYATHDRISHIVSWLINYYAENISADIDEEDVDDIHDWADMLFPDPCVDTPTPAPTSKEPAMSKITAPIIETRTYILGADISTLDDDALYQAITTVGAEIERLEKVTPKPKKLAAKIVDLQEQQQRIVELVDARP